MFHLRFNNDREVVVRIPCPVVGDVKRTVESEVATMNYVGERWAHTIYVAKPPKGLLSFASS